MHKIGSRPGQLVVHAPGAGKFTRAALQRSLQGEQAHNVPRIGVEDLPVRRVRGAPNDVASAREVLDV